MENEVITGTTPTFSMGVQGGTFIGAEAAGR